MFSSTQKSKPLSLHLDVTVTKTNEKFPSQIIIPNEHKCTNYAIF